MCNHFRVLLSDCAAPRTMLRIVYCTGTNTIVRATRYISVTSNVPR